MPALVLVGRDGRIVRRYGGEADKTKPKHAEHRVAFAREGGQWKAYPVETAAAP